jgi:tRNA nucleotidyltransferase (CCA-adding enzyme)
MIAKEFCYACNVYGAESYIKGFSGYSIELLIAYYKSFTKMIQGMSKSEGKLIIDIEKDYKNKNELMMNINSSKTNSPVILIDPTFPQRNALAALSQETFDRFKEHCKKFLKSPSLELFEMKKTDVEKIKLDAKKKKLDFVMLEAKTKKQEGDIAGSKLLKFYNHLVKEVSRYFEIKNKGFNYNGKKSARYFLVCKNKKEFIQSGPFTDDKKNVVRFVKEHKNIFEKNKRIYAREKIKFDLNEFIEKWKKKNSNQINGMKIEEVKIID